MIIGISEKFIYLQHNYIKMYFEIRLFLFHALKFYKMKRRFTLFVLCCTAVFFIQAQNASFGWFLSGGGATGADRSADVVTDASGNIFTANTFLNTASFNGNTFIGSAKGSGANYDNSLLISKISPLKATMWSIYSNLGAVAATSIAVTPDGSLIATGTIRPVVNTAAQVNSANIIDAVGTVTTFNNLFTSTSINQSFVAKFNSSGVIQWVKELNSGTAKDKVVNTTALATDATGNVYLLGDYTNSVILPASTPVTLTSTNLTQATFIAKLNGSTGDCVWSKNTPGLITKEFFNVLTFGDDGYLYAAGTFKNIATPVAVSFGDKNFTPSTGTDLVWLKFDVDGAISYIQRRENVGDTRVKDMVAKNGQVFIAGSFRGDTGGLLFPGGTPLTSTAAYLNGFITAFNTVDGTDLWQKTVSSPAIAEINGLSFGNDGNLFAFGYHYNALGSSVAPGDVVFGNGFVLTDATNKLGDLFLSSYKPTTGVTQEVHLVGKGLGSETSNSLCSYGTNLYLLGSYSSSPITLENTSTSSTTGAFDFFLANYTVANPAAGTNSIPESTQPFATVDYRNKTIILNNASQLNSYKLLDISGRCIKTAAARGTTLNMRIENLESGIYILQMFSSTNKITSQRLIIH